MARCFVGRLGGSGVVDIICMIRVGRLALLVRWEWRSVGEGTEG